MNEQTLDKLKKEGRYVYKKYENDNNTIKQFIDENIVAGERHDSVTKEELKTLFRSDFTIRNTFGKFATFIKQFENALCTEFRLDKKNVPRIYYWRMKTHDLDDNSEDSE
jgi:hypothetical protein